MIDTATLADLTDIALTRAHAQSSALATRHADLADAACGQVSVLAAELERRGGLDALPIREESS